MGEGTKRAKYESQLVKYDFAGPALVIGEVDRLQFGANCIIKATKWTMAAIVHAAYPQGMADSESDHWEAWKELLDDPDCPGEVEIPYAMVAWFKRLINKEELRVPAAIVQWRRALGRYVNAIEPAEVAETATPT